MAVALWVETIRGQAQRRFYRRVIIIAAALVLSVGSLAALLRFDTPNAFPQLEIGVGRHENVTTLPLQSCTTLGRAWDQVKLKNSASKYKHLREDKFTIAMQTYRRPTELAKTLQVLLSEPVPSLLEIVIVWNDLEAVPPKDFTSPHGVKIRYRKSARNSLNEKLLPDPEYQTKAILLSDDDVYYHPSDLEFVFQSWRKFGQDRLTGALARCHRLSSKGTWEYHFCSKSPAAGDSYSMILTNLSFVPISFLDFYSSDHPTMVKIRKYVDDHFNCEDIALNHMASMLTQSGPLLVKGHKNYVNYVPTKGISTKPGHLEARSQCLNDFAEMFACMPLVNETAHVERGVVVL